MDKFNSMATISHRALVTDTLGQYDMTIGRGLLHELGIDLQFSTATMQWWDLEMSMKESTCTKKENFHVEEALFMLEETNQIAKI